MKYFTRQEIAELFKYSNLESFKNSTKYPTVIAAVEAIEQRVEEVIKQKVYESIK